MNNTELIGISGFKIPEIKRIVDSRPLGREREMNLVKTQNISNRFIVKPEYKNRSESVVDLSDLPIRHSICESHVDLPGPIRNPEFSLVSFNVGDVWGDDKWNEKRWKDIMEAIISNDADIVVLHEMTEKSSIVFDQLTVHGYTAHIPYLSVPDKIYKRENYEVMYCKFVVSSLRYIPISVNEGLSFITAQQETTHDGIQNANKTSLDVCAMNWSPNSRRHLRRLISFTNEYLKINTPLIVALSSSEYGSFINPPNNMIDVWTSVGPETKSATTLNSSIRANITEANLRADHIWVNKMIPRFVRVITVPTGAEHFGLSTKCSIPIINDKPNNLIRRRISDVVTSKILRRTPDGNIVPATFTPQEGDVPNLNMITRFRSDYSDIHKRDIKDIKQKDDVRTKRRKSKSGSDNDKSCSLM